METMAAFPCLALYIFNKADQHCEYSELIPEFTPHETGRVFTLCQCVATDKSNLCDR